jgi:Protein of unknown function (DUF2911)
VGANEATEIEFFKDVMINKTRVKKGRYTFFAIPEAGSWTLILNKDNDSWGSFRYDAKKDVVRLTALVQNITTPVENLSIYFQKEDKGISLQVYWDTVSIELPISFL